MFQQHQIQLSLRYSFTFQYWKSDKNSPEMWEVCNLEYSIIINKKMDK